MSGITPVGGILVKAGPNRVETTGGGFLNVDQPIGRELADLIRQTIEREGLTPDEVMAVEFRGEGYPIITSTNERYQIEQVKRLRAAANVQPVAPADGVKAEGTDA